MDADMYDGTSEQEDLQATQLVHDLLAPASSPMRSMELRNPLLRNLFADSNDISESQLSSRASNSAPQYHFHGLASTQTQSQFQSYVEDIEVGLEEGSQKENIGAGKTTGKEAQQSLPSPGSRSPSPHPSQSKDSWAVPGAMSTAPINKTVTKKTNNVTFESPRHNTHMSTSPLKAVTRQSPHKPGAMSTRHKPVPRPSSRASSVDSFARDPELDNAEERLIANAEQFNIPISELGKGSSRLDASDMSSGISNSFKIPAPAGVVLCPDSQESNQRSRSHEEEEPRSTTSDLQETQPFELEATQLEHDPSGNSYESSQAASDIAGFYKKKGMDDSGSSLEQTQLASEVEDEHEVRMVEQERRAKNDLFSLPATTFTSTSTGSGLMSMVHSSVRSRYEGLQPMRTEDESSRPATSSLLVETQPSFPEAPPPKRSIPAPRLPLKKLAPTSPAIDPLDVVPDSEPPAPPEPVKRQPQQAAGPSKPSPAYTTPLLKKKTDGKGASSTKAAVNALPVLPEEKILEDDSEGEGSPLAAVIAKRPRGKAPATANGKGKEKAPAPAPEFPTPTTAKEKATAKPLLTRSVARNYAGRSWETGVVPSSVPDQDVRETANRPTLDPPPPPVKSEKPPRSTSTVPKSKGKRAADDGERPGGEPVEEDQPEEEEEETSRNKRRKRTHPPSETKPTRNAPATKRAKRGTTATPARSLRSETTKNSSAVEGTRVFALWPQDGHWYAGVVHSETEEGRYHVHFDDTNRHCLRISEMRLCDLRPDDEVLYDSLNRPARVVTVDGLRVMVELDGKTDWKVMRELRIPNMTIRYGWNDRTVSKPDIVTTHSRQTTATPSRPSAVGTSANDGPKHKHLMGSTGFIITARDATEKDDIQSEVKRLGGHILDNFPTDVIDLKGDPDKKNNWILSKKQAVWKGDRNTKRLFLIADDSLLTPKYLMALALGIPCVSQAWLTDSAESDTEKDWSTYLLPQGFSPSIGARLSQQVDADWGSSIYHLHRIMDNGVPSKLFKDMNILYIVSDSPGQKTQKKFSTLIADDKAQPSYILLGMGAEMVETVATPAYASKDLEEYDYIVVRDNCSKHPDFADYLKVVEWTWVKECLIASRILPIPIRGSEDV
ncbi:hypothetical protein D9619_005443 [Psilocybe cf. subviscida]|uniref:BRCT domain-containing protein n=1 Tax=Psilocybe cf. subviscida TaxID=2480587 RepID=A0A8H5BVP2_9AGAR|nr:hypothetical protein D9619_005443 [Psilocybe cf. subviscida]